LEIIRHGFSVNFIFSLLTFVISLSLLSIYARQNHTNYSLASAGIGRGAEGRGEVVVDGGGATRVWWHVARREEAGRQLEQSSSITQRHAYLGVFVMDFRELRDLRWMGDRGFVSMKKQA
jgi:hypothetical protein